MKQSPLLEFESSAFPVTPGEDRETNPGLYGKALAEWIAEKLPSVGFEPRRVIAEDFGWLVQVETKPHSLYVAAAATGERPDHWRVFVFAEGGFVARLLGKDRRKQSVEDVFAAVKHVLEAEPGVRALRVEEG